MTLPIDKLSSDERKQRRQRAQDWKLFRVNNLFTQRGLAETMGMSRRTIQQIEGGTITPHPQTLRRFAAFRRKYDLNEDIRTTVFD